MVNISEHKTNQRKELASTNIKFEITKHAFSPDFSQKLHEFSKIHYKESIKEFRLSWKSWISTVDSDIQKEIIKIKNQNFTGSADDILQKIYISARFYYRKKEKRENRENREKCENRENREKCENRENRENRDLSKIKPYIGFTKDFIKFMDCHIQSIILLESKNSILIKMNQKKSFYEFIKNNITVIDTELGILKEKYDALDIPFVPMDIANKLKKAYQNRFYSISTLFV